MSKHPKATASHPTRWGSLGLALAIAIVVLCSSAPRASAAVVSSSVTAPNNPSYFQLNDDNSGDPAHQVTVSGTTTNDGTPGNVNLICTYGKYGGGSASSTLAANVKVLSDGSFSWSGPPPAVEEPCVIRAVPAGAGLPSNLAPYSGPTVGLGDFSSSTVSGGPNGGQQYDFYDNSAQFAGDADYKSVGAGALFDAYPADSTNLVLGKDLFFANDYLSDQNSDRSDIEIDGIPAYAAATAEGLLSGSANYAGLPTVSSTSSLDPSTGDLVIHESEPLVKCEPSPNVYPATTTSCTSFASTGVSFNRTIVQYQDGRQAQISDTYASTDGSSHALDIRYGQDMQNSNAGFNFPWVDGSTYNTHSAGDIIPAPPTTPATMYVNWNNSLADGAENSAQGAITFSSEPSGIEFASNGFFGNAHFYVSYSRTVPAGGTVNITTTYSWAFAIADAQALAAIATQPPPVSAPPAATTGSVSSITDTSATVSGWENPNGETTHYHFEYGTTPAYGNSTSNVNAGSSSRTSLVSANLTGLTPGTKYYYRLVASNASGTSDGSQGVFFTTAPASANTQAATNVTDTSATLNGAVNPNGLDTTYHFEYGTTPSYGTSTTATDDGSGTSSGPVSADVSGLTPGTQYYYRVVATSSAGTADGSQGTFTTTQPPSATTGAATGVTNTTATISGSVDPNGLDTSYHFEYGTTPSYGTSTTATDDGSGTGTDAVSAALSGLTQGTTYYYRLVAISAGGTTDGSQGTFTTTQPPTATTGSASSITPTATTIAGSVNPNGVDTTYHFEYGTTPSYGTSTTAVDDGGGTTTSAVHAGLTGLTPATTYYFRLVATSVAGTTDGLQGTFTTTQAPAASTGAATAITTTTATIAGSVNPNGQDTSYHFEYGTTPSYGSSTAVTDEGSGTTSGTVTANLTGLASGTKYYYRLVATSVAGTADGSQASLTTATPAPPPPPPPPPPKSPPPSSPPPPVTTVTHTAVKSTTAAVSLGCSGATGSQCSGTLVAEAMVKHHGKKVMTPVGGAGYAIAAGSQATFQVTLNGAGKAALARAHTLRVTLLVKVGTNTVATRTLVFKSHKHKK